MARVNVSQKLNVGYAKASIGRGPNLRRALLARGLAVRTESQRRLRQSPRRIDTGNLINSIQVAEFQRSSLPVVRVGTNVDYAVYVHEGTRYMEPNPFLRDGLVRGIERFKD